MCSVTVRRDQGTDRVGPTSTGLIESLAAPTPARQGTTPVVTGCRGADVSSTLVGSARECPSLATTPHAQHTLGKVVSERFQGQRLWRRLKLPSVQPPCAAPPSPLTGTGAPSAGVRNPLRERVAHPTRARSDKPEGAGGDWFRDAPWPSYAGNARRAVVTNHRRSPRVSLLLQVKRRLARQHCRLNRGV
jgi:hypothetical protein